MFGYYGLFYDPTMILAILGLMLTLLASSGVKSSFHKYSKIRNMAGTTGMEAAQRVLNAAGIYDVRIERVSGDLTDHYDPRNKVLRLSDSVYNSTSIAAVGVAAHECGHAIQDARGYVPLNLRSVIVPVANIGSSLSWPIFILGLIMGQRPLLLAGIVLFLGAVVFQLVTLPVEFNASRRAMKMLETTNLLYGDELAGARKVLNAAAMTYVAALASSILQLLRLVILAGGGRRDD